MELPVLVVFPEVDFETNLAGPTTVGPEYMMNTNSVRIFLYFFVKKSYLFETNLGETVTNNCCLSLITSWCLWLYVNRE